MSSDTATVSTGTDWRAVADELADALRQAMLRNPTLTARAWDRAHAALGRYEDARRLCEPVASQHLDALHAGGAPPETGADLGVVRTRSRHRDESLERAENLACVEDSGLAPGESSQGDEPADHVRAAAEATCDLRLLDTFVNQPEDSAFNGPQRSSGPLDGHRFSPDRRAAGPLRPPPRTQGRHRVAVPLPRWSCLGRGFPAES